LLRIDDSVVIRGGAACSRNLPIASVGAWVRMTVQGMSGGPGSLLLGVDALDDDTVVKRTKFHCVLLSD
jgi:hypothetical protein